MFAACCWNANKIPDYHMPSFIPLLKRLRKEWATGWNVRRPNNDSRQWTPLNPFYLFFFFYSVVASLLLKLGYIYIYFFFVVSGNWASRDDIWWTVTFRPRCFEDLWPPVGWCRPRNAMAFIKHQQCTTGMSMKYFLFTVPGMRRRLCSFFFFLSLWWYGCCFVHRTVPARSRKATASARTTSSSRNTYISFMLYSCSRNHSICICYGAIETKKGHHSYHNIRIDVRDSFLWPMRLGIYTYTLSHTQNAWYTTAWMSCKPIALVKLVVVAFFFIFLSFLSLFSFLFFMSQHYVHYFADALQRNDCGHYMPTALFFKWVNYQDLPVEAFVECGGAHKKKLANASILQTMKMTMTNSHWNESKSGRLSGIRVCRYTRCTNECCVGIFERL